MNTSMTVKLWGQIENQGQNGGGFLIRFTKNEYCNYAFSLKWCQKVHKNQSAQLPAWRRANANYCVTDQPASDRDSPQATATPKNTHLSETYEGGQQEPKAGLHAGTVTGALPRSARREKATPSSLAALCVFIGSVTNGGPLPTGNLS